MYATESFSTERGIDCSLPREIHNFKRNASCNVTLEYSKPNVPNVMLSSKYIRIFISTYAIEILIFTPCSVTFLFPIFRGTKRPMYSYKTFIIRFNRDRRLYAVFVSVNRECTQEIVIDTIGLISTMERDKQIAMYRLATPI